MIEKGRARLPEDATTLAAWLKENGDAALTGKRENQNWKEWWCLARLFEAGLADDIFPTRFEAEWLNRDGEADFRITGGTGSFFLEITEATTKEDRRAISLSRNDYSPRLVGEDFVVGGIKVPGGRGKGGFQGDSINDARADDIEKAIRRKARKLYAANAILLVYPNSNLWMADMIRVSDILTERRISFPFRRCIILSGKNTFELPAVPTGPVE